MPHVMDWTQLLSTTRFKVRGGRVLPAKNNGSLPGHDGLRSDFHVDHDRVVFSSAFRRLGRKTQVHPLAVHDHTHNRLTHSVEVGCVGRSLGNRVGAMLQAGGQLPPHNTPFDIGNVVQVACLAHDIGNPPFGHTGEEAIRDWFRQPRHAHWLASLPPAQRLDIQTYEGNAHTLRMVSTLEMYRHAGGMRLTAAAIGSLIKYPWAVEHGGKRGKFNLYQAELAYFRTVAQELGLPEYQPRRWARHPLSYLMEAADDICYAILDLEDAVEMGWLDAIEFERLLSPLVDTERVWHEPDVRQRCAMLRGMAVGHCVVDIADVFMRHHDRLLAGDLPAHDLLELASEPVGATVAAAKDFASRRIYRHRNKQVMEIAAYPCLAALLDVLVPAAHQLCTKGDISTRQRAELSLLNYPLNPEQGLYAAYMAILDFVGGLTDNAAARLARDISGLGLG